MGIDHDTLVGFAKSWGLFYLIAFSIAVLAYTFWPSNRKRFDRAKKSILDEDDKPLNGGPLNGGPLNGGPLNGGPLNGGPKNGGSGER